MSDSILLQALVNIANGLILESISDDSIGSGCTYGELYRPEPRGTLGTPAPDCAGAAGIEGDLLPL